MDSTLAKPPPVPSPRGFVARVWEDPESRSTAVGLLGVVIFYLLLWLIAPFLLRFEAVGSIVRPHASAQTFNIEIAPDTFAKPPPKPPPPTKFVETNPDAPENIPDRTNNFSDRNQQVAQEKPTPDGKSERPALEGKKDFQSTQIVTGQLAPPAPAAEPVSAVETPPTPPKPAPRLEQNPLSGFEKTAGDAPNSFGSNIAKSSDNAKPIPEKIDGLKNAPVLDEAIANQPAIDPQHPRVRKMLATRRARPAVFEENRFGTANVGAIAQNAKWSQYGTYLQRLIETVQLQWDRLNDESRVAPPAGSTVVVSFILDSSGRVARIVAVDNKSTEQVGRICVSAITDRAPYGEWSDDMKAALGDHDELTFRFIYDY